MHLKEGTFELDLKLVKLGAKLAEEDRQCAWELYTEMVTRVSVVGKASDNTCSDFTGEILSESLDSLYRFLQEARGIMRKFPVGRIGKQKHHLGILVHEMIQSVLRPFLEKWHGDFRYWIDSGSGKQLSPLVRQRKYPKYKLLLDDWQSLRLLMREAQGTLVKTYGLIEVEN